MESLGKVLMAVAGIVFLAGVVLYLLGKAGGGLLPGDIVVRRQSWTFVFPVVTMLVVSVVLTVVLNLFLRR